MILLIFVFGIMFLLACGGKAAENEPDAPVEENAVPAVVSVEITTEPFVTPAPLIHDEWYADRNEALIKYVRAYGSAQTENDVLKQVSAMAIDPDKKRVAFTFDDGPRDELTDAVLDICEEYNVRVTFFIKGSYIAGHEAQLKRMLGLGCEIGNHTWDHVDIETLTPEEMRQQIESVNQQIESLLDYHIQLFRPPYIRYGKNDPAVRDALKEIMERNGMAVVNHTRSSHDTYDNYTEDMIYERCVAPYDEESAHGLHNAIILCHDKTMRTVNAFRRAVPELQAQGFQFVTVSELLYCSADGFHPGWIYSKAD